MLDQEDADVLADVHEHAALMWVWVVSLISRAAQDQQVPHMGSPTYGRLVMLANSAEEAIRQVVVASKVQLPFVYVHTLALLVHTNNLLCAIGFHIYSHNQAQGPQQGSIAQDVQSISM